MIDIVFLFLLNKCKNCLFGNQIIFLISLPHILKFGILSATLCLFVIFHFTMSFHLTDDVSSLIQ